VPRFAAEETMNRDLFQLFPALKQCVRARSDCSDLLAQASRLYSSRKLTVRPPIGGRAFHYIRRYYLKRKTALFQFLVYCVSQASVSSFLPGPACMARNLLRRLMQLMPPREISKRARARECRAMPMISR